MYAIRSYYDPDLALYQYIRSLTFEESPKRADALYKIGYIHEQRGNLPLARKAYEQAKEIQPDDISVLSALGQIYMKERNYVQAETLLLQAIGLDQQRMGNNQAIVEGYKIDLTATQVDTKSPVITSYSIHYTKLYETVSHFDVVVGQKYFNDLF